MWTAPVPDAQALAQVYRVEYRSRYQGQFPQAYFQYKDLRGKAQMAFINKHTNLLARAQLRMLDIGCAAGSLLWAMSQLMLQAHLTGYEPDPAMIEFARQRLPSDAELYAESFTAERLGNEKFDLISASHLLEHIAEPIQFLQELWRVAAPRAILFVEVPYETAISVKALVMAKHRGLMHLVFFNERTLSKLLARTGWNIKHTSRFGPSTKSFSSVPSQNGSRRHRWVHKSQQALMRLVRPNWQPAAKTFDWGFEYGNENPQKGIWLRVVAEKTTVSV